MYSLLFSVLLLVVILILFSWYCWRIFAPYSKFHNHVWMDRQLIYRAFLRKRPRNMSGKSFTFQRMVNMCKKSEADGMCVIWTLEPVLFVYGEEALKFFSNEPTLIDKPRVYKFFDFMSKGGIFASNGATYKNHRRLISPAFYPSVLKDMIPVMNEHGAYVVEQLAGLKGKVSGEVDEIMKVTSLKLFFETALGLKADTAENDSKVKRLAELIPKMCKFLAYRFGTPWLYFDFMLYFSSHARKCKVLNKELHLIIEEVIDELKEEVCSQNQISESFDEDQVFCHSHRKCIGTILIQQHLKDPSFTLKNVRSQLVTIISAGFHTVSDSLTWTLWLLGLHQDIQERVYEEIVSTTTGDVDYEDTRKMTYLECVIKESLRLYPVVSMYPRCSTKDIQFGKYTVPKGTPVVFFPYLLHRNPEIYPDPESFNPGRFAEMNSNIKPWTYVPFAEGGRPCTGKTFAMLEMKIILPHILRNFKVISLTSKEDVVTMWELVLLSSTPLRMQFVPR